MNSWVNKKAYITCLLLEKCTEKGKPCLFLKIQVNIYALKEVIGYCIVVRHHAIMTKRRHTRFCYFQSPNAFPAKLLQPPTQNRLARLCDTNLREQWRSYGKAEWAVARPAQPKMGKDEMKYGP